MNRHDASYRQLFRHPHMVRSLFDGIINEPWLNALDWQGLQSLPTDYISAQLRERRADCVWRLPRHDDIDLFMLLMFEHQSQNDYYMALRSATYCGLQYESLLQHQQIKPGTRLPVVLPVVLYSGVKPWTAPTVTTDLIDQAPSALPPYLLSMRYLLIDEGEWVRSGKLPEDNLATLLFQLEHNRGIEQARDLMQTILNCTPGPEYAELRRAFYAWVRYTLLPRALPKVTIPAVGDLLEIKDMLTEHSRSWTQQWKMEGHQEGEAALLQRLLIHKFGPLPEHLQQRVQSATLTQLEAWSLNVLDAQTMDDVFDD